MIAREASKRSDDPGVPEALTRTLIRLRERLGVADLDRMWIFPPVRSGRREQGLIAVSTYLDDGERRRVVTVAYQAEHTGAGVTVESTFTIEGEATPDRFGRVMEGVVRRGGEEKGDPREVEIDRSPERYEELMAEYDAAFLEVGER